MKSLFKALINSFKINLIPFIYFYLLFYLLVFLKNCYVNKFAIYLQDAGYIKTFKLIKVNNPLFVVSIAAFLIMLLLCYLRSKVESAFKFIIIVFIGFLLLGSMYLLMDLFEVLSLLYFVLYGGLISVVFGLRYKKLRPDWMDKKGVKSSLKLELIKISLSNWWRGLTILTTILIAIFISALVSWVLTPPPEQYKIVAVLTLKQAFFLFFFALPGLIFVYLRILKQINYYENLILEL